jgi:6-phosphogluconolactonase
MMVFETREELFSFFVSTWQEISLGAVEEKGAVAVALSGGKTPVDAHRALAGEGRQIPWKRTHVFLVDERFVPHTDKDSNFRMIQETLLAAVPVLREHLHPVDTRGPDPEEAARRYEGELIHHFRLSPGHFPRFDIMFLGLGQDGHTASLFPGDEALHDRNRIARGVILGNPLHDRVTLTLNAINHARHIMFIVTGEEKARALKVAVTERKGDLPASWVEPMDGSLLFLADRKAAGLLSKEMYMTKGFTVEG